MCVVMSESRVWGDDYEPTPDELDEPVSVDATPEELACAVLKFKPFPTA